MKSALSPDMSILHLKLGDTNVQGITTRDGVQVFSIYDFINVACQKTGTYSRKKWKRLISNTSKFTEVTEDLGLPTTTTRKTRWTTPGMTIMGLKTLLYIINKEVKEDLRIIIETTFARYMQGDTSMITQVDLKTRSSLFNTKKYGHVLRLHYNFEPPTGTLS
jgi:hypothetical protein